MQVQTYKHTLKFYLHVREKQFLKSCPLKCRMANLEITAHLSTFYSSIILQTSHTNCITSQEIQTLQHADLTPLKFVFCYHVGMSELLFPAMSCIAVGGILFLLTNMQVKKQNKTHSCFVFTSKYCDFKSKDTHLSLYLGNPFFGFMSFSQSLIIF